MAKPKNDQGAEGGKINCDGFLSNIDFWTEDVAENIANVFEIVDGKLSEKQWEVINFVRDYYKTHGQGPAIVMVAKHTGLKIGEICDLFPCGLVKGAYKVAGLPRPPGCV